jgi:hypothetical protein
MYSEFMMHGQKNIKLREPAVKKIFLSFLFRLSLQLLFSDKYIVSHIQVAVGITAEKLLSLRITRPVFLSDSQ